MAPTTITGTGAGYKTLSTGTATLSVQANDFIVLVTGSAIDGTGGNNPTDTDGNVYVNAGAWTSGIVYGAVASATSTVTITQTYTASRVFSLQPYGIRGIIRPGDANIAGIVSNTNTTPSTAVTSSLIALDSVIIGLVVVNGPNTQTFNEDTDSTNGSWSAVARAGTTGGSATSNSTLNTQIKVCTAAGTQTYNPTLGTSTLWRTAIHMSPPNDLRAPRYAPNYRR